MIGVILIKISTTFYNYDFDDQTHFLKIKIFYFHGLAFYDLRSLLKISVKGFQDQLFDDDFYFYFLRSGYNFSFHGDF